MSETAAARNEATAATVAVTDTPPAVESAAVLPSVVAPDLQPEPAASATLAAPAARAADFSAEAEAGICAQVLGDRRHGL
ncbi:MAG: hypothetical protein ACRDO2_02275 [Nocardioidaceae bacterium]